MQALLLLCNESTCACFLLLFKLGSFMDRIEHLFERRIFGEDLGQFVFEDLLLRNTQLRLLLTCRLKMLLVVVQGPRRGCGKLIKRQFVFLFLH